MGNREARDLLSPLEADEHRRGLLWVAGRVGGGGRGRRGGGAALVPESPSSRVEN